MTNLEPESVEPTPEAPDAVEVPLEKAPEAPEVGVPESPAAEAGASNNRIGLIAGLAGGVVVAIIAAVLITLAVSQSGFFSKSKPNAGDPAETVKAYFAARTCTALQAQMAPADWSQAMATSTCQDSQVAAALSTYKVTIKSITIEGTIANVAVTVGSTSSTAAAQSATINLIQVAGKWKVDHVIAKAS